MSRLRWHTGPLLGRGSNSTVHRARMLPSGRQVAVKRLQQADPRYARRLRQEAEFLRRLRHENIVELIDVHEDRNGFCLLMELVEGCTLAKLINTLAPAPPIVLYIARELFKALDYAHSREVVHRDISPRNVLLSWDGEVKLTDFGLAKLQGCPPTTAGVLRGTVPYVSPEQVHGDVADHRSDLYAVGVLLYELIAGRLPFEGDTVQCLARILRGAPILSLRESSPWVSSELDALVMKLLCRDVEGRYQSAAEVLAHLPVAVDGRDELVAVMDALRPPEPASDSVTSSPCQPPSECSAGPRVTRYSKQERLGHGGMGVVWRGTRTLGNGPPQTVAFKFIKDRFQHGQATIEQIEHEARTAMSLHHANIAAVYDVADVDGQPCIIMEYVDGIDLRRLFRRVTLPANLVRCILHDVLSGLQHAHERGVLHRDLSPANIMIDRDGVARLMDFGVARNLNDSHSPGLLVGTAPFMAPETLEAEEWSRASDRYSLGAVLYTVLAGTPPYGRGDRLEVLRAMRSAMRFNGRLPLPDIVPADLRAFAVAALQSSPARRQADYAAAVEALEPSSRADRALLGAEVRRAMREIRLDLPCLARPGSARYSAAHADADDADVVSVGQDGARLAPGSPALAGCGHDTSTTSTTIRRVSGILPTQEVATGMSDDRTTHFLDTLYAWYQAGEPASGDDVTPVQIDLASVHRAFHKIDQVVQDEAAVAWSHFLQACQIKPPNREWIWQAIEKLTNQLGYDVMYFESGPEPAEPAPDRLVKEPRSTERHVEWAKYIYEEIHEDVYGYRPNEVGVITPDMDEVQRFLTVLSGIVVLLPALRTEGFVAPPGESLPVLEEDITMLFRFHDALPEADKQAIEREWEELVNAMDNYKHARLWLRSLYERMAEKLGRSMEAFEDATTEPMHRVDGKTRLAVVHSGSDSGEVAVPGEQGVQVRQSSADRGDVELEVLPTLPAGQGESSFAGPVLLPDKSRRWTKRRARRVGAIGGVIVGGMSAVVLTVVLLASQSEQPTPRALTATPATDPMPLPLADEEYSVCLPTDTVPVNRPAPAVATPALRKASKLDFMDDTDSVIIKQEGKPDVVVTVTEVSEQKAPENDTRPTRSHSLDVQEVKGYTIEFGAGDMRLNMEFGE